MGSGVMDGWLGYRWMVVLWVDGGGGIGGGWGCRWMAGLWVEHGI